MKSFTRKLEFWIDCVEGKDIRCFPKLSDFLIETDDILDEDIRVDIGNHLRALRENLQKYFPVSKKNLHGLKILLLSQQNQIAYLFRNMKV